jgi:hypothetical protein
LVEVSTDQVAELSERVSEVRISVARIEERQGTVISLLEKSQLGLVEYHLRLQKLEADAHTIKTKLWLVALISGAVCSTLWEIIKARFLGRHI